MKPFRPGSNDYLKKDMDEARRQVQQLENLFDTSIIPALSAASGGTAATPFEQALDFAPIEKSLKLMTKIDVRLDKALARLFKLQTRRRSRQ